MRPTLKKLEVKDIGDLEKLVAENVEGIEAGLKVIDSRLLLGRAAIDLVGLDAKGSLVLIALDFTADEGLLLRVMDAYSWCLEYPDTIRRLYPMAQISPGRPPRFLFIVERLTDSFVRRIKQLSFLEIDCLEFRHLEVNGTSALYFDLVQRLRKSEAEAVAHAERQAPQPLPFLASRAAEAPSVAAAGAVSSPAPVVAPARPMASEAPAAASLPEPPAPQPAPALDPSAAGLLAEPVESAIVNGQVEAEAAMVEEPVSEEAEASSLELESIHAAARQEEPVGPSVDVVNNPEWHTLLSQLGVEPPVRPSATLAGAGALAVESEVSAAEAPAEPPEAPPVEEPRERPAAVQAAVEIPKVVEPLVATPPAWAKPAEKGIQPSAGRTYFFAQAAKGTTPAEPQAAETAPAPAVAPAPAPGKATEVPADDRPELESLNFPKDGLSRQWLEFLNQLSATK